MEISFIFKKYKFLICRFYFNFCFNETNEFIEHLLILLHKHKYSKKIYLKCNY